MEISGFAIGVSTGSIAGDLFCVPGKGFLTFTMTRLFKIFGKFCFDIALKRLFGTAGICLLMIIWEDLVSVGWLTIAGEDWNGWWIKTEEDWNGWLTNAGEDWNGWLTNIGEDWNGFSTNAGEEDWNGWLSNAGEDWNGWLTNSGEDWNGWLTDSGEDWNRWSTIAGEDSNGLLTIEGEEWNDWLTISGEDSNGLFNIGLPSNEGEASLTSIEGSSLLIMAISAQALKVSCCPHPTLPLPSGQVPQLLPHV